MASNSYTAPKEQEYTLPESGYVVFRDPKALNKFIENCSYDELVTFMLSLLQNASAVSEEVRTRNAHAPIPLSQLKTALLQQLEHKEVSYDMFCIATQMLGLDSINMCGTSTVRPVGEQCFACDGYKQQFMVCSNFDCRQYSICTDCYVGMNEDIRCTTCSCKLIEKKL